MNRKQVDEYVLGFYFDKNFENVVLIEKTNSIGCVSWNGLGGKIEGAESPLEAMIREFNEEAGVLRTSWWFLRKIVLPAWKDPTTLVGIYVFYTFGDTQHIRTMTVEPVHVIDIIDRFNPIVDTEAAILIGECARDYEQP